MPAERRTSQDPGASAESDDSALATTPMIPRSTPDAAPPEAPLLRVTAGRDALRFALVPPDGALEVGRDEGSALRLSDTSVSRHHLRLTSAGSTVWAEDLLSRNGTLLNGERLTRQRLSPGDRLVVGSVPLRFDLANRLEVAHLERVLERLASAGRDPLTGLLTRAWLDAELPPLLERCEGAGRPVSAAFIDVDHFKAVNDRFGHATGDDALRQVGRLVTYGLREGEVCVRYGGEEIVAVFEGLDEAAAAAVTERIRAAIEGHEWACLAPGLAVTVSGGVAQVRAGETVRTWLERADRALYLAKHTGRNQVRRAE